MKRKKHLSFEAENLAVPEVHVHGGEAEEPAPPPPEDRKHIDVKYDNLAVPEVIVSEEDPD